MCTEVGIAGYAILFHTEGLAKCHMGPTVSLLRLVVRNRSLQTGSQTGLFEVFYIDRSITPLIWNTDPFLYKTQTPSNLAIEPLLFASHRLCCSDLKRFQIFFKKDKTQKTDGKTFPDTLCFQN